MFLCAVAADTQAGLDAAKTALRAALSCTNRGELATSSQRAQVEECQLSLEAFGARRDLDYALLAGKWRLIYTTAPDVAPLLAANRSRLSPLRVGPIYQEFSNTAVGRVDNIIQLSVPFLLEPEEGVTVRVGADYEVRSSHRIALTFREAGFGDVRISPLTEALLAPALLPRGWLQHRLLLAIRELSVAVPLRTNLPTALHEQTDRLASNVGSEYLLTFLDEDMLVGRQTGTGGVFIFDLAHW